MSVGTRGAVATAATIVLLSLGCSDQALDSSGATASLVLYVSNQSFDEDLVDITVTIDGAVVVDDSFAVEDQHRYVSYELDLRPGEHRVAFSSDTGIDDSATISLAEGETRWALVDYWYDTSDADDTEVDESLRRFRFLDSDEPFVFG